MERNPTWVPVVAAALLDPRGRVLMHRRPPGKHHAGLWEFPGGKVEIEEIPIVALQRELREELAIELDPQRCSPVAFVDGALAGADRTIVILLYSCTSWQGEPAPQEGGAIEWVWLDQLGGLALAPLDRPLAAALLQRIG